MLEWCRRGKEGRGFRIPGPAFDPLGETLTVKPVTSPRNGWFDGTPGRKWPMHTREDIALVPLCDLRLEQCDKLLGRGFDTESHVGVYDLLD